MASSSTHSTHDRSNSPDSMLSSRSVISDLSIDIEKMVNDRDVSTDDLVKLANARLSQFKQDPSRLTRRESDIPTKKRLDPHLLLKAMLDNAPTERGRRYVSAAVIKCDDTERMVYLSNTWLRYLLLPFKGNKSNDFPASDAATPSSAETEQILDPLETARDQNMRPLVKLREGYQCWITNIYHSTYGSSSGSTGPLENCHIIKRALGAFDSKEAAHYTTWDIIKNYVGWDAQKMQDIVKQLDSPANGMLVLNIFHSCWENFSWSLKPVVENDAVVSNTYQIEVFYPRGFPHYVRKHDGSSINHRITFADHGNDANVLRWMPATEKKYLSMARPPPNPELIALHRAICGVLHMSGAGEIIDLTFQDLGDAGVAVPSGKTRNADDLMLLLSTHSLNTGSYEEQFIEQRRTNTISMS